MKIKKILFIIPPALTFKTYRDINPLPPVGLGYLASIASDMGFEVKILDCLLQGWDNEEEVDDVFIRVGLSDEDIRASIMDFDPDVVGISCQFSRQRRSYHRVLSVIKKAKPECITIAGGAHTTVCPREILGDKNCDFILIGEAEQSLKELLVAITNDRKVGTIDGLGWKEGADIYINEKTRWIDDLDSLPIPSYSIMNIEKYFGLKVSHGLRHRDRFMPIVTSRGCPAKCVFCSAHKVWGDRPRFRSVDNVLNEMKMLKNRYKIEELMFEDDNVTANPKRAKELFSRMISERLDFVWDTPNGAGIWSMDEEMIGLMKRSGCMNLNFPVESGSQYILDNVIKKPIKLSRVKQLIRHCKKIDLAYNMFLVIGMPGETVKDIWSSFKFAAANGCYEPHISVATPYPGTKLFEECTRSNLFVKEFNLDDLFIRSFMIRTSCWSDRRLKDILSKGLVYLKIRSLLADPPKTLRRAIRAFKRPGIILKFLKDTTSAFVQNGIRVL